MHQKAEVICGVDLYLVVAELPVLVYWHPYLVLIEVVKCCECYTICLPIRNVCG